MSPCTKRASNTMSGPLSLAFKTRRGPIRGTSMVYTDVHSGPRLGLGGHTVCTRTPAIVRSETQDQGRFTDISACDGFVRQGHSIKYQHCALSSTQHRNLSPQPDRLISNMQLSHNFSRMALFVLALASIGTATPFATVSDTSTNVQVVHPS